MLIFDNKGIVKVLVRFEIVLVIVFCGCDLRIVVVVDVIINWGNLKLIVVFFLGLDVGGLVVEVWGIRGCMFGVGDCDGGFFFEFYVEIVLVIIC